ncbi:hypothetical protein VAS14_01451 [Photobacterium angustum S14]|uniref:Uncharacterized protein n=1 Tax=Photobacterium angustum (strain S14 / CCUG 15956) TaxID=314292 RepID=Q1ZQF5_PHOAS|nr:hypothetical protein VAS14_01451 [Photobacterium angustum S14]
MENNKDTKNQWIIPTGISLLMAVLGVVILSPFINI